MKVKFWGVRGSIAAPGATTAHFGGNTSCYEVISRNGTQLILDSGTGVRQLGLSMLKRAPLTGHMLISHTHWDHIQGFPFFLPAFVPGNILHMYGPIQYSTNLASIIKMQMGHEVFPVREQELKSSLDYHDLGEGSFKIEDLEITTKFTNHPVMTLSYRIEDGQSCLVYSGDTEPYHNVVDRDGMNSAMLDPSELREIEDEVRIQNRRHIEFCRGANLLIHDAQYTESEYLATRRGWGHSPVEHALFVGKQAGVQRLALSHHDPTREDKDLFELEKRLLQTSRDANADMDVFFARELTELEI